MNACAELVKCHSNASIATCPIYFGHDRNAQSLRRLGVVFRHLLQTSGGDDVDSTSVYVVLHGSLKVGNKIALVQLADGWFGIIHAWTDGKMQCNLVLSLLAHAHNPVPWLGDISKLGPSNIIYSANKIDLPVFPIQTTKETKRSYGQPTVAWIRATGLQTDVQKILRSAKKLPEKSQVWVYAFKVHATNTALRVIRPRIRMSYMDTC